MGIFKKKEEIIGLDIGSYSVKGILLSQNKKTKQLEITNAAYYEILADPAAQEIDREGLLIEGIKNIITQLNVKTNKVIVSTPGQSLSVKDFKIPAVPDDKLDSMVRMEATQQIPFPIEDVELDYEKIVLDDNEYLILMGAVKKEVIDQLILLLSPIGLEPEIIDIRPFAVFNTLLYNKFIDEDKVTSIIDIGAASTDITIVRGSRILLTRTASTGGRNFTKVIQRTLQNEFPAAEKFKISNISINNVSNCSDSQKNQILTGIKSLSDKLVGEIRRSFDYFKGLHNGAPIDRIIITGGGSKIKGLISYFNDSLDQEIILADPIGAFNISDDLEERMGFNINQFTCAIGLALRSKIETAAKFNLLPQAILNAKLKKGKIRYMVAAAVLFVLTLFLWGYSFVQEYNMHFERQNKLKKEIARLKAIVPTVEKMKKEKAKLTNRVEAIKTVIKNKKFWLDTLRELVVVIPKNVWLNEINFAENNKINFSATTYKLQDISILMGKIENSPYFKNVELGSTSTSDAELEKDRTTSFSLSFELEITEPIIIADNTIEEQLGEDIPSEENEMGETDNTESLEDGGSLDPEKNNIKSDFENKDYNEQDFE